MKKRLVTIIAVTVVVCGIIGIGVFLFFRNEAERSRMRAQCIMGANRANAEFEMKKLNGEIDEAASFDIDGYINECMEKKEYRP